tara:strand:- start:7799 stop:8395 length:597 start_codon:yes stop_codon:yes gene_type:complete
MEIKFSKIEIRDLAKAWIVISIAFAIVLSRAAFGLDFFLNFILAAITVGTGFLFHELGHKVVAQRYGCFAEFRADNQMLFLAVIISFLGVIFAAPGAVMIAGRVSKKRNGLISIAGPVVNIVFAISFMIGTFFVTEGFVAKIFAFGFLINAWLALFNLIPFWILDGKKVWNWSKVAWSVATLVAVAFVVLSSQVPLNI